MAIKITREQYESVVVGNVTELRFKFSSKAIQYVADNIPSPSEYRKIPYELRGARLFRRFFDPGGISIATQRVFIFKCGNRQFSAFVSDLGCISKDEVAVRFAVTSEV